MERKRGSEEDREARAYINIYTETGEGGGAVRNKRIFIDNQVSVRRSDDFILYDFTYLHISFSVCPAVMSCQVMFSCSLACLLTSGLEMKEMARPLVPNLPALPTRWRY